jgi:hypothetical protein
VTGIRIGEANDLREPLEEKAMRHKLACSITALFLLTTPAIAGKEFRCAAYPGQSKADIYAAVLRLGTEKGLEILRTDGAASSVELRVSLFATKADILVIAGDGQVLLSSPGKPPRKKFVERFDKAIGSNHEECK